MRRWFARVTATARETEKGLKHPLQPFPFCEIVIGSNAIARPG
jgi:hypothetical protein